MVDRSLHGVSLDRDTPAETLWLALNARDRRALARVLTWIGEDRVAPALRDRLKAHRRRARTIAVTGPGGVGKSSLVGRLIEYLRGLGKRVGVLACDPESPLTGGALLGDRARMPSAPDEGLFIRSVSSSRSGEAIAPQLDLMILALDAFGFEVILIETAGAGQADTAIRDCADVVVLLVQPEAGDELQWQKAGLIEVADILVIHKADLPTAERVESQVRSLVNLPGCREVPIIRVSSLKGTGLATLWGAIETIHPAKSDSVGAAWKLWNLARDRLARRFQDQLANPEVSRLALQWESGEVTEDQAVDALLGLLRTGGGPPTP